MRRIYSLCLLAYPRSTRERDGNYLRDLAVEMAQTTGCWRQAMSLLRGGLAQRLRQRSALVALATTVALLVGTGAAVAATGDVEVETPAQGPATHNGKHAAARPQHPVETFVANTIPDGASGALVTVRGEDVTCLGFGLANKTTGTPADCDTVFDIGSVTKQFTGAAIVKLQSMGRLDVHDPISRWLGPVPPDKTAITVQQLLTHTAGLVDGLGDDYQRVTRPTLIKQAIATPLRTAPGSTYHYSNLGYSLLAVIIERASGTTYERFLSRHLFRPAGMHTTGYVLPKWARRTVAIEYDAQGVAQGRPFDHPWAASGPWWNLRGNGGMLSTAHDMARWHQALNAGHILDRRAHRQLFRPRVPEQASATTWYGYGWVLADTPLGTVAWHNGGNNWSYAELTRVLSRNTMVFWVTNQMRSRGSWNLSRLPLTEGSLRRLLQ